MRFSTPGHRHRRSALPVLGLVLAGVMALSACGDDDDAEAAADGGGTAGGSGSDASGDEVILDFYQCLRDNGLDVEDPDMSGDAGGARIGGSDSGIDPNNPEHVSAIEDCQAETGLGGPGGVRSGDGEDIADTETLVEFAACMREHGIDMPDPAANGALQMPEGLNRESPEFEAAVDECRDVLSGGGVTVTK